MPLVDGRAITEIDEEEIIRHTNAIKMEGIVSVVIIGVFTSVDTATVTQEERVRDIVLTHYPECDVVCSRDIGGIGFVQRENASSLPPIACAPCPPTEQARTLPIRGR